MNPILVFRLVLTRSGLVLLLISALALPAQQPPKKIKKNEDKEPVTQTLPVLKDPPAAVAADPAQLVFHVSPLSGKGLLSQQVRDALKALFHENRDAQIVKLRAFVAGSGDVRRVQTLVSEIFTDRKQNIPALSTIQVGALPGTATQVVIETMAAEKKPVNPNGLAFFSGQQSKDVRTSLTQLQNAVAAAGVGRTDLLRITCFLTSLDDASTARELIAGAFPQAATDFVQPQRIGLEPLAECEAVGRLQHPPAQPVTLLNPEGLAKNPNYSQIALVNAPKIVITGTQMAFAEQESDIKLAFDRLRKELAELGADPKDVFWSSYYPLTRPVADKIRGLRFQYFDAKRPPASTFLLFEGLPSLDASMAVETIAAGR
jgi:enamine deaminase RidA (YjgF/YER057c/UK114 family)